MPTAAITPGCKTSGMAHRRVNNMTTITTSMTLSIAGSGMIVEEVLRMLRDELPDIQPRSIFAHSNVERARQLAADYDIPQVFTDYDLMLRDDKSDFV